MDPGFCEYSTWWSEGASARCQKWEVWICFVSRNVLSVVETVNGLGLSFAGSGTLNDQRALFPSDNADGRTWDPYSPTDCFLCGLVALVPPWLTGETWGEPRHYTISGKRRGHEGQLSTYQNMTPSTYFNTGTDWADAVWEKGEGTMYSAKTTSIAQSTEPRKTKNTVLCFCQIRQ